MRAPITYEHLSQIPWIAKVHFRKLYGRHRDLANKCDTFVSHMLKGLFTNCDIWLVSSYRKSWQVPHVGQEMLTLSGTPNFTPLGSSLFHPLIINTCTIQISVLGLCLRINNLPALVGLLCIGLYILFHCRTVRKFEAITPPPPCHSTYVTKNQIIK